VSGGEVSRASCAFVEGLVGCRAHPARRENLALPVALASIRTRPRKRGLKPEGAERAHAAEHSTAALDKNFIGSPTDRHVLAEAENSQQSLVDAPLLLWTKTADKVAQAAGVDSANLLDEDTGRLAQEVNLRTEGGSPRAARCRRYEYYRAGQ
jgi:hypothetical protein